jgi:para-nitrobenzyl esterase
MARARHWLAAVVGAAALLTTAGASAAPTAFTDKGPVVGVQLSGTSPAINAFLGVPYAAPPVGDLRFKAPQAHASWTTPVQATQFAPPCTQFDPLSHQVVGSENCLYLNVYAPALGGGNRPVMVFLPGGGFVQGSASFPFYDGRKLAQQSGAVVVVVTYRVGALGFLTAPALDAETPQHVSGNYGLLDQQAALKWVARNIAAFGGSPFNVTLFGESAGANSTEYQLASPLAAGLFHKAIVESAVGFPLVPTPTLAQQEAGAGAAQVQAVGCAGVADVAACLRAVPAQNFLNPALVSNATTYPVIDNYVLKQTPLNAFRSGQFNKVPVITGSNSDEFTNLLAVAFPQIVNPPLPAQGYQPFLANLFGPAGAAAVVAQYPLSAYPSTLQAVATVFTDAFVACQTEQKRAALAGFVQAYGYEFSEQSPAPAPLQMPPVPGLTYGAYHTAELPYVFGLTSPAGGALTGADLTLSQSVIGYWTNFAAYSQPNGFFWPGNTTWPQALQGQLLNLKKGTINTVSTAQFKTSHKCAFWAAALPL